MWDFRGGLSSVALTERLRLPLRPWRAKSDIVRTFEIVRLSGQGIKKRSTPKLIGKPMSGGHVAVLMLARKGARFA